MEEADRPSIVVANKGLLTIALMTAVIMQVLDSTIANVALPHMQASLGATQDSINWILTSYIVASTIAIPLSGWLSDRWGVRGLFLLSVFLFVAASVLCGIATSLPMMVAMRILQGIGGAFLGPLGQAIMLDINRPSEHGRAMSLYGMGVMIGPITGPVLGGWLTENFDWRWVFFINLPIGILCFIALWFLMPRVRNAPRHFDLPGWALIALALGALQLMLDRGEHVDWFNSTETWLEAGVALAAAWMFVTHMLTAKAPIFARRVVADRNLMVGCLFMFMLGVVQMSGMALIPSLLQTLLGYPVLDTGILLATRGVGVMLSMAIAGMILHLLEPRLLLAAGFLIIDVSLWMMTDFSLEMDRWPVLISGIVQGLGIGFIFVPLNVLSFATLPARFRTDGAGLFTLFRNTGASIGIAVATLMLARNIQVSHADLAAHVTPYNFSVDPTLLSAAGTAGQSIAAMIDAEVNRQAAMIAYLDDFYLMMLASLATLPMLLIVRRSTQRVGGSGHIAME